LSIHVLAGTGRFELPYVKHASAWLPRDKPWDTRRRQFNPAVLDHSFLLR
jgi:hypothetical protein